MTKIRTFRWVCLFAIFLALIPITETGAAENIYVSPGGSIQVAVDQASPGDTILVKPGEYNESVQINQDNLTIISDSKDPYNTVIIGENGGGNAFKVIASNVTISGFSIVDSKCGIYLNGAQNCTIRSNNISKNDIGICLSKSDNNTLSNNIVYSNIDCGIRSLTSSGNAIYNNFFNNTNNARENQLNAWNLASGNYWNDYAGRDGDGDGIGDTAYVINHRTNSIDYRPLMNFTPELKVLPEAIFTSNVTVGYAPLTVEFTDFSENASSLLWYLENLRTSNSSGLLHTFVNEGSYRVILNVTNENGSDSTYVTINVLKAPDPSVPILPEAKIGTNVTGGYVPLTVHFVDFSENADSVLWSFGNGKKSCCQDLRHTFCCPGNYTVSLTAENNNGSSSKCIVITVLEPAIQPSAVLPAAKFNASTTRGPAPLTVEFVDISENVTGRSWNFGDGNQSAEKSPEHTYMTPGNYTVSLTVGNENGNNSKKIINLIQVEAADSTGNADRVGYSGDTGDTANTGSAEDAGSKGGDESTGIARIISKENLGSVKDFALSSAGPLAKLKPSIEHETLKVVSIVKNFAEESVPITEVRNISWLALFFGMLGALFFGMLGISSVISVLKRGRK